MTANRVPVMGSSTFGRRQVLVGAAATLAAPAIIRRAWAAAPQGFVPPGYSLAFGDDFTDGNVARINENATGGTANAPAWRSRYHQDRFTVINKEKQIYMDAAFKGTGPQALGVQPFSMKNGILTITADRADPTRVQPFIKNYAYTSGCMTSELTHAQTYGYFEMRAEVPRGKGFWPAFWLMPKDLSWPPELDIMEGSGARPNDVHVAEILKGHNMTKAGWINSVGDTTEGFHHYGLLWTADTVTYTFDGKTIFTAPNSVNQDMYILVNMALGSHDQNWIPDPDASTPFPGHMRIDYIRAYSKA